MTPLGDAGDGRVLHGAVRSLLRHVDVPRSVLSALSFWFAIALPVLYLPLLAAGIETVEGLALFLGLFGLHVVALVGGRAYHRTTEGKGVGGRSG